VSSNFFPSSYFNCPQADDEVPSVGIYSKHATANSRRSRCIQLLHIPALISLILSIAGGTDQFSSDVSEHASGKTETRAGIILFLLVYLCIFLLCMITFSDFGVMVKSQRRIFVCVLLSLPLIGVRLLYSLIGDFDNNADNPFSMINGNVTIRLVMATIEEFLVVLMFSILGVVTPRATYAAPHAQDDAVSMGTIHYAPPDMAYSGHAARIAYNGKSPMIK
jgi:hypothetical protein